MLELSSSLEWCKNNPVVQKFATLQIYLLEGAAKNVERA